MDGEMTNEKGPRGLNEIPKARVLQSSRDKVRTGQYARAGGREGVATARAGAMVPKFLEQYGKDERRKLIALGKDIAVRPPLKQNEKGPRATGREFKR